MNSSSPRFIAVTLGQRIERLAYELEALGTTVLPSKDQDALLEQLDTLSDASVIVLSGDLGREAVASALHVTRQRYASVPTLWIGELLSGAPLNDFRATPDAILHEPVAAQGVQDKLREL